MWKRLAVGAIVVIAVVLLGFWIWTATLASDFDEAVAALRDAGEPVAMSDLATEPVPDADNVAAGLREVGAWLEDYHETHEVPFPIEVYGEPFDEEERDECEAYARPFLPLLDELEEAVARPRFHLEADWNDGVGTLVKLVPALQAIVRACRSWVAYGGPPERFNDRFLRAASVLDRIAERCHIPGFIGSMVIQVVQDGPTRWLHEHRTHPDLQPRRLQAALDARWRELGDLPVDAQPLREERAFGIWVVEQWRHGKTIEMEEYSGADEGSSKVFDRAHASVWMRPALYRDALRFLDHYDRVIDACGGSPDDALAIAEEITFAPGEPGLPYAITHLYGRMPPKLFREAASRAAHYRLARVALALLGYVEINDAWPASLEELGEMPTDPYSGGPFEYERGPKEVRLWCAFDYGDIDPELAWETRDEDGTGWRWDRG